MLELSKKVRNLNNEIEQLRGQNDGQGNIMIEQQKTIEETEAKVAENDKEISELRGSIESHKNEISELKRENESQSSLIEEFKGIHASNQKEIAELREKIHNELSHLTMELAKQSEVISQYENAYRQSAALVGTKDEEISTLCQEKQEKTKEVEALVSDLASKQIEIEDFKGKVSTLEVHSSSSQMQLETQTSTIVEQKNLIL